MYTQSIQFKIKQREKANKKWSSRKKNTVDYGNFTKPNKNGTDHCVLHWDKTKKTGKMKQRNTLYKLNKDVYFVLNAIFVTQKKQISYITNRIRNDLGSETHTASKRSSFLWRKQWQYCHWLWYCYWMITYISTLYTNCKSPKLAFTVYFARGAHLAMV